MRQLAAVILDVTQIPRQRHFQPDVFFHDAPQQRIEIRQDHIQIRRLRLGHLLPRKRQQLLSDRGRFFPCHFDLFDALHVPRTRRPGLQHHFRISQDHAEQVVEVMSDPARQPANCFHLLRKQQLLFQPPRPFLLAVALPHGQFALQRFVRGYQFRGTFAHTRLQRVLGFAQLVLRYLLQSDIPNSAKHQHALF